LCSHCTNSIVFLLHELEKIIYCKSWMKISYQHCTTIPLNFEKQLYEMEKKSFFTARTGWKFPSLSTLSSPWTTGGQRRADSSSPHTEKQGGQRWVRGRAPSNNGRTVSSRRLFPTNRTRFGVDHQPRSPGLLICLYDHRWYGLLAIDKIGDWKQLVILVENQSFWNIVCTRPTDSTSLQRER